MSTVGQLPRKKNGETMYVCHVIHFALNYVQFIIEIAGPRNRYRGFPFIIEPFQFNVRDIWWFFQLIPWVIRGYEMSTIIEIKPQPAFRQLATILLLQHNVSVCNALIMTPPSAMGGLKKKPKGQLLCDI